MLEKACQALEQAGKGGGVFPEVLFDVAQMWEFIHLKVCESTSLNRALMTSFPGERSK